VKPTISPPEVVAALIIAAQDDANQLNEIRQWCGDDGERIPESFMAFANELYARGFSHGRHTACDELRERLVCAGQTAGAALIERIGAQHVNG
jgi:hypothetical protein